jgi:ketosteroid isomerase-like protein
VGRRTVIAAIIVAVIAGAWYYFTVYRPPREGTDREQILRLIASVEKAVEQGRVSAVMDYISEDYQDPNGYNRRMIHRMVLAGARDQRRMNLSVQVPEIEVSGDTARFVAEVGMMVDGSESRQLTVTGKLRREGGRWMVVSADGWQGAGSAYY